MQAVFKCRSCGAIYNDEEPATKFMKQSGEDSSGGEVSRLQSQSLVTGNDGTEIFLFYSGYHPLSRFHVSNFQVDGLTYKSIEQYYQAEKARTYADEETCSRIMKTNSPHLANQLGDTIVVRPDEWTDRKKQVVTQAVRAKAQGSRRFQQLLLKTQDKIIAQATSFDEFWGIGLHHADPDVKDHKNWPGLNEYGKILMQVRSELKEQ